VSVKVKVSKTKVRVKRHAKNDAQEQQKKKFKV
jgi:hypothetical protein